MLAFRCDFAAGNNATYNVLGTDYETYTAVYSCENIGSTKFELAWINTRSMDPDPLIVGNAFVEA